MRKPDFFIVGAPKSGTTSFHQYLEVHPDICMPETIREPNFFGRDHWVHHSRRIHDEQQYLQLFAHAGSAKRVGEKSPLLFYSQTAAQEIHEYNPQGDIIISLRNPADMLYSWHRQCLTNYNETILDFEEALAAEPDRARGRRIPKTATYPDGLQYTKVVDYVSNVKRYLDVFGQDKVCIVFFDDIVRDTEAVYRHILSFLGVDPDFDPGTFSRWNPKVPLRSLGPKRFFRQHPKLEAVVRKLTPRPIFRAMADTVARVATPKHPAMSPELRARLQRQFLPDVEKLSVMLGRDLTPWCRE